MKHRKYGKPRMVHRIFAFFLCLCMILTLPGMSDVVFVKAAAITASPGIILSNQEWGAQTLTAGTYTINSGVTVTVSGKLTVSGTVTIKGGGKLVRASSYTGDSSSTGDNSSMFYVNGGTLTLENLTVDGNSVNAYGPAIYIGSGTVNMKTDAVVQNNINMNTGTTGARAAGGIYCGGTLNIDGGTIKNCRTSKEVDSSTAYAHAGGGIYLKGTCNMTAGSITGNGASNGGGVYLASTSAVLRLSGGAISGNSATAAGNGIYYSTVNAATSKVYISGDANVKDTIYLDNTSGELYPYITSALHYPVTLSCSSVEEGKVLAGGDGYTLTSVDASKISMTETSLYSRLNKSANQIYLSQTEEPEATWQESAGGSWKMGRFTTALENVYDGGTIKLLTAIIIAEKAEITKTITITSNNATDPCVMTRMPSEKWGNITINGGNLTLTNVIYDGNRDYIQGTEDAKKQSLIKVGNNADDTGACLTLGTGAVLRDAYKSGGSGLIAVYGTMTMNGGAVVENCEVTGTGGGVWISANGSFTMNGGTIRNCKVGGGGAAISIDGTCTLSGGSITGNTDTSDKACAVYLRNEGGKLTLNGVSISGNTYSVYNGDRSVTVAGDSTLSGSIYTTNAITALGNAVSSLTKTYAITLASPAVGTVVVDGSKDTQHYKLENSGYGLKPVNTTLVVAQPYKVTLNYNGGSGNTANIDVMEGTAYGELPTPNTRTGYTFDGWYTAASSGNKVTATTTVTNTAAHTLYAHWTANTYTITYNKNSGTIANESSYTSYTYGTGLTLPTPTRTGYTFGGWYTSSGLTGTAVTTISTTATGNKTYYAKWTASTYTITYKDEGNKTFTGTHGSNYPTQHTYGTATTLVSPTKTGYTFGGWYTNSSCTNKVSSLAATSYTATITLYAKWTPVTYTITYELDGGTVTGNPVDYTIESSAITLKNPTKEGYSFAGWSGTNLTGDGNTSVTIAKGSTGNRTYTAHWTEADYTVTLHTNGGSGGTEVTSYAHGTAVTLPADWTRKGYAFAGWYDNEDCNGNAVAEILVTDTGDKEYWAKWTDNTAPVIGTLTYSYQMENFRQWLIGREDLIITVPVIEEGSGADEITYTVTPEGGTAGQDTSAITDGRAAITVSADFKGTITITCTDKDGNTSQGVTVGKNVDGNVNGIIIEDNAPQITCKPEGANLLQTDEYDKAPSIAVTVTDDKDNVVSAGIASITYQIGNGSIKTSDHDYTIEIVASDTFTISAEEIPAGETVITITATDHAGNTFTATQTVKVHTHSGTLHQAIEPTCTDSGKKAYYTCTCGRWFSDSNCTQEIEGQAVGTIPAKGHEGNGEYEEDETDHWKLCIVCHEEIQKETHEYDNATDAICNVCGYERAIAHTHSGTLHQAVEPTCTESGKKAYYTCTCGRWFSDSNCTQEIEGQTVETIPAKGHRYPEQWTVEKEATESESGRQYKLCEVCGMKIYQTIDPMGTPADPNAGKIHKEVEVLPGAPDTVLNNSKEELAQNVLTAEEIGQISSGVNARIWLEITPDVDITEQDKAEVEKSVGAGAEVTYFDASLFKQVADGEKTAIHEPETFISITIVIPEEIRNKNVLMVRNYQIIRLHDGEIDILEGTYNEESAEFTFETDKFSTYAIYYKDAPKQAEPGTPTPTPGATDTPPTPTPEPTITPGATNTPPASTSIVTPTPGVTNTPSTLTMTPRATDDPSTPVPTPGAVGTETKEPTAKEKRMTELHSGLKAVQTGGKLSIAWGKVSSADGYSVYVQYCGKKFTAKSLYSAKNGKLRKITVKKVNGKKLDTTKNFKMYIVAYKLNGKKKITLAETITIHIAGKDSKKYTNVRTVKVKKTSYTLKKGAGVTVSPKAVLYDKNKRQLSVAHAAEFRYMSSNRKVATVSPAGKIRAKGPGECIIYVYAKNGTKKKIKVKVM